MQLPAGKAFKTGLDKSTVDFFKLLEELRNKKFNGYLCLCIKGERGIEEGTLLLDTGKIVGATYSYMAHGVALNGKSAFERIMNATAAKYGMVDIYELDVEQIHLALAVNDDVVFVPQDQTLKGIKVEKFSPIYEQEILSRTQSEQPLQSGSTLLKKFKMSGLSSTTEEKKNDVMNKLTQG